jgi:peroxiredoxin
MTIQIGDTLPNATLHRMTPDGPEPVELPTAWAGQKVALFSVPGAFTPTCSARHLPGFVEKAADLRAKGIDRIVGTAVNDVFVIGAWARQAEVGDAVELLADGNATFVSALGLTFDGSGFGLGTRGQRFSMVVDDGTVTHLFVEEPGAFEVSSAEHLLRHL